MSIFELVFIAAFLIFLATLLVAAYMAIRGRFGASFRLMGALILFVFCYLMAVVGVALAAPQRILHIGDEQRWDDFCIVVTGVQKSQAEDGTNYQVTFRVLSRALRTPQRARDVETYILDTAGHRYYAKSNPEAQCFDRVLQPKESFLVSRTFHVPGDVERAGLVVTHGGSFPGCFIIGDPASLFHKKTVVQID